MAWKISTAKRRALVKLQLRDKNGRWIEMGGGVKWYSSKRKKVISGTVVGTSGNSALVRLNKENPTHEPELVKVPAHNIEVVDAKASLKSKGAEAPSSDQTPEFEKPEAVGRVESKISTPYVKPSDSPEDYDVTDTPDGHTYVSRKDKGELYFPARQLDIGDELLAPDGADPSKPFSMGKSWAKKGAERLNTAGPKTGKVVAIEGDRYAIVQLPEGHTVDDKRRPGEQTDKVTVGLSNSVIKLTPGIKSALGDKLNENFNDNSEQDGGEEVIDPNAPENVSDHIGREVTDEEIAQDDANNDVEAPADEVEEDTADPVEEDDAPVADPEEEAAAEAERKARDEDLARRAAERKAALDTMGDQYNDEGLNEAEVKMIEAYERMANRALDNMEDDRASNFLAKAEEIRATGKERLAKAGVPDEEPAQPEETAPESAPEPEKAPEPTPKADSPVEEPTADVEEEGAPVNPGEGMPTLFSTAVRGNTRSELEFFDETARESEQDQGYRMNNGKFEVYDFDRAESSIADAIDIWENKKASADAGGFVSDTPAKVRAILKGLEDLSAKVKAARNQPKEPENPASTPNLVEPDAPESEQPSLLDGVQDEINIPGVRKQSKRDNEAKHLKTLNGLEEGDRVSYTNAHDETVTFQKHADGTWDEIDTEDPYETPVREAIPAEEIAGRYKRNELEVQTLEDREQAEKDERYKQREKGPSYLDANPDPVRPTGRTEPTPEPMDYSDSADEPWSADDIQSNIARWFEYGSLIKSGKLDEGSINNILTDDDATFIVVNDQKKPFDVTFARNQAGDPVVQLSDFDDSEHIYGDWEIDNTVLPHHLAAKIHEAINSDDPEEAVKQSNGFYDKQEDERNAKAQAESEADAPEEQPSTGISRVMGYQSAINRLKRHMEANPDSGVRIGDNGEVEVTDIDKAQDFLIDVVGEIDKGISDPSAGKAGKVILNRDRREIGSLLRKVNDAQFQRDGKRRLNKALRDQEAEKKDAPEAKETDAPETPEPTEKDTPEADQPEEPETPDTTPEVDAPSEEPLDSTTEQETPAAEEEEVHPLDALGIERRTPEAVEGESYAPTQQQQDVIDAVLGGLDTKVQAMAGTGKTSTLVALSRRIKDAGKQAIYIAFNKTVQTEAEERMAGLPVEAKTGHGVAYQWAIKNAPHLIARLNGGDPSRPIKFDKNGKATDWAPKRTITSNYRIADMLGVDNGDALREDGEKMKASSIILAAKKTVEKYALSDKDDILPEHIPDTFEIDEDSKETIVDIAKRYWEDLQSEDGNFRITHDTYRKLWALSRPDLTDGSGGNKAGANILYIDEAQDTPPVLAKVVADQKMQKVIVGDPNQAIYAFAENIDYLSEADGDVELPLNKSWRFGPQVADIGNRFLEFLGSEDRVVGGGGESTITYGMEDADAVLVRTNAGMISAILEEAGRGRRVSAPNGTREDLTKLVKSVQGLMAGDPLESPHDDLIGYSNWDQVLKAWNNGDTSLNKIVGLFDVQDDYTLSRLKPSEVAALKKQKMENSLKAIDSLVIKVPKSEGIEVTQEGGRTWLSAKDVHPDPAMAAKWDSAKKWAVKNFSQELGKIRAPEAFDRSLSWGDQMNAYHQAGGLGTMGWRFSRDGRWYTDDKEAGEKIRTYFGESDVTISTAHKSKGLEWDRVRMGDDFFIPREDPKTGEMIYPDEGELKLGYVAVTRAAKELDPGVLGWIYEHTSENGGDPKKKTVSTDSEATPEQIADEPTVDVAPDTEETSAPEAETSTPAVSKYDEDGLTPTESARLKELDEILAKIYRGEADGDLVDLENEWNDIGEHGERRLAGEDLPEFEKSAPVDETPAADEELEPALPEVEEEPTPEPEPAAPAEPELDVEGLTPEERKRADDLEQWIYDIYRGKGQGNAKAMDDELTAILNRGKERLKPKKPVSLEKAPQAPATPKRTRESYKDVPVLDANGTEIKMGDTIGHRRLGPVQVTGFLPSSGRVQYIDPTTNKTASVKGDNVSIISEDVDPEVETVVGQPGERFTDPVSGKKGFYNGESEPIITGQRVRNRQGRTGVVTGVYRGADGFASVPVLWDDTNKVARVKGVTLELEDKPDGGNNGPDTIPEAPQAPDTTPEPEAPVEAPSVVSESLEEILDGYDGQSDVTTGYDQETSKFNPTSLAGREVFERLAREKLSPDWEPRLRNYTVDADGIPVTHGTKIYHKEFGHYLGKVFFVEPSADARDIKLLDQEELDRGRVAFLEFRSDQVTAEPRHWDTSTDLTFDGASHDQINRRMSAAYPGVTFSTNNSVEIEMVRDYAAILSRMFNRFPMLQHSVDAVTTKYNKDGSIASVSTPKEQVAAFPYARVNFNTHMKDAYGSEHRLNRADLTATIANAQEKGWFNVTDPGRELEQTVTHEMGHAIDSLTGWMSRVTLENLIEQYLREIGEDRGYEALGPYLKRLGLVSEYSLIKLGVNEHDLVINAPELVAEAFADVELNGRKAKRISKLIHRELMNRLKGLS